MESLMEALYLAMEEDDDVRDGDFQGEILAGIETRSLSFVRCKFQNVTFGENEIAHLSFVDCELRHCDLSGLRLVDGSLHRTNLFGCRAAGMTPEEEDHLFNAWGGLPRALC